MSNPDWPPDVHWGCAGTLPGGLPCDALDLTMSRWTWPRQRW